jgi:hypothetical protein
MPFSIAIYAKLQIRDLPHAFQAYYPILDEAAAALDLRCRNFCGRRATA